MPLPYHVVLLLVIIISLVPHLCVIILIRVDFSLVRLIKEIRDRYIYVPGFDRFSLNCMVMLPHIIKLPNYYCCKIICGVNYTFNNNNNNSILSLVPV